MSQYSTLTNVADIFKDEKMNQLIEHCQQQDKKLSILAKVEVLYSHDGDVRASGSFYSGTLDSTTVPKYTMYKIIMDDRQLMALNHLGLLEIHLCGTRSISYRDASSVALWIPPATKGCNGYAMERVMIINQKYYVSCWAQKLRRSSLQFTSKTLNLQIGNS